MGSGGVMVSVLASSAVDRGFEPRSGEHANHYTTNVVYIINGLLLKTKV
jgi:hypothetical protein